MYQRRGERPAHSGPARGQCRGRTWQSHRAAPQASPSVYTAREKDTTSHRNRSAHSGPARGQRRGGTWQSHRAAPQASPSVYTEKDPRQGLRCLRYGPSRAPCPGSPILSGAPKLPPCPCIGREERGGGVGQVPLFLWLSMAGGSSLARKAPEQIFCGCCYVLGASE